MVHHVLGLLCRRTVAPPPAKSQGPVSAVHGSARRLVGVRRARRGRRVLAARVRKSPITRYGSKAEQPEDRRDLGSGVGAVSAHDEEGAPANARIRRRGDALGHCRAAANGARSAALAELVMVLLSSGLPLSA
jgi:hypothetical protein